MFYLRSSVLLLVVTGLVLGGSNFTRSKRYHLSEDKVNFFQAFINCKNDGMELAAVENETESKALDRYLDRYKIEGYENGIWLSGTHLNNVASKQFYWLSNGRRAAWTNWLSTEPNNFNGVEHCMAWDLFQGITGWADHNCETKLRYVCEYRW